MFYQKEILQKGKNSICRGTHKIGECIDELKLYKCDNFKVNMHIRLMVCFPNNREP